MLAAEEVSRCSSEVDQVDAAGLEGVDSLKQFAQRVPHAVEMLSGDGIGGHAYGTGLDQAVPEEMSERKRKCFAFLPTGIEFHIPLASEVGIRPVQTAKGWRHPNPLGTPANPLYGDPMDQLSWQPGFKLKVQREVLESRFAIDNRRLTEHSCAI